MNDNIIHSYYINEDRIICITKCGKCMKENHAIAVSQGYCAWCGFNPNDIENKEDKPT